MKQKIYNIIVALAALLLLGEEAREYSAQPVPESYTVAPALPTGAAQSHNKERTAGEPRYWHVYATYEVTDTTQGSDAIPGGQVYQYRYTHPRRQAFYQEEQPTEQDITFVPPALRDKKIEVIDLEIIQRGR